MFKMGKNFKTLILLVSISLWIWSATTMKRRKKCMQGEKDTFANEWERCKESSIANVSGENVKPDQITKAII